MQGRQVNWCCNSYSPGKHLHKTPLDYESLQKQIVESKSIIAFLMKRRQIMKNSDTEMELSKTNQHLRELITVLKERGNVPTPSIPQKIATEVKTIGTQTAAATPLEQEVQTEQEEAPMREEQAAQTRATQTQVPGEEARPKRPGGGGGPLTTKRRKRS